ncbi:MAG: thymidine phosphorylase, partial [Verrucomicrobiales bacterium]|nr:thymidine phosphorylase [Verrucomicrobiales bacterium]
FGCVMIGQTADICPADKKLYALRDVTGTVPSIPLITASIMSKKLAEGLNRLVLDVKFGSGAFMQNRADAETLAAAMVRAGEALGVATTALLNPMNEPTGHSAGNALEVAEAVACLQGRGPSDLEKICLELAAAVSNSPRDVLAKRLRDGTAWERFQRMVEAQGGDLASLERITAVHAAPVILDVRAKESGQIIRMDSRQMGLAVLNLGAGRATAGGAIDFAVGCDQIAKTGTQVRSGDVIARIHARSTEAAAAAAETILSGVEIR